METTKRKLRYRVACVDCVTLKAPTRLHTAPRAWNKKMLAIIKGHIIVLLFLVPCLTSFGQRSKNFNDLGEALSKPDSVQWLTLRDQGLQSFPPEILQLKNLRYLDLSQNKIQSLPENIGALTRLTYVDLSGNSIAELPVSFGNLSALRNLYIDYNGKQNLELDFEVLSKLPSLTVLDLAGDSITNLPSSIGMFKQLKYLELSYNQIEVLPNEFVQLKELEVLSINGDSHFDLRKNLPLLSQLPKLRELHLEGDQFRDIQGLGSLKSLEALYLNDNELGTLPEGVNEMKKLRYIDMSHNRIPHIQRMLTDDALAPRIVIKF